MSTSTDTDTDAAPASYWTRREEIASLAAGLDAHPAVIDYDEHEHAV